MRNLLSALLLAALLTACDGEVTTTDPAETAGTTAATTTEETTLERRRPQRPRQPEYRTIDGTGNNPAGLGVAGTDFRLEVEPVDYQGDRPGAREISNLVGAQSEDVPDPGKRSAFVWAWGQFLDHDITLTFTGDEEWLIPVPAGDPYFDPFNTGTATIPFTRSVTDPDTGNHFNAITHFIDGSMIYGSDEVRATALRTFQDGQLATSAGDLPPFDPDAPGFFLCGDIRANEHIVLASLHTLFIREHNRFAQELKTANPALDDEALYQRARKHVGALVQIITYREFLPALLGGNSLPPYEGYDPSEDPSVGLVFATAGYRLGHSQVGSVLYRLGPDGQPIEEGNLEIRDAFFQPQLLVEEGGVDPVLRGLAATVQQKTDTLVIDDLRNFLFGPPGAGGFDLLSLNIQRGRDHGLPDYNTIRQALDLPPRESHEDPWVGFLSEEPLPGAVVGPGLKRLLADQFRRLRDGDRFFYRNDPDVPRDLERTRLSDVIRRNSGVTNLQANVFFTETLPPPPNPRPARRRRIPHPSL